MTKYLVKHLKEPLLYMYFEKNDFCDVIYERPLTWQDFDRRKGNWQLQRTPILEP